MKDVHPSGAIRKKTKTPTRDGSKYKISRDHGKGLLGKSVSISDDGKTVQSEDHMQNQIPIGLTRAGVTEVWRLDDDSGEYKAVGKPIWGTAKNDQAGWSVSLSADGKRLARSVRMEDLAKGSTNQGSVEIYEYQGGKHWTLIGSQLGEDPKDQVGFRKQPWPLAAMAAKFFLDHSSIIVRRARCWPCQSL